MKIPLFLLYVVAASAALVASACSSAAADPTGPETSVLRGGPETSVLPGAAPREEAPVCDPSPVAGPAYATVADLTALVVGRWVRCDGPPQLENEELGIELTDGRLIFALLRGPDGAVVRGPSILAAGPESWSALDDDQGRPRLLFLWASSPSKSRSSFVVDGPFFFDGGDQMFLPYSRVGATYVRLPS